MPVYKMTIAGVDTPRLVRADSAAKARDHVVKAEACSGDEVADLIEAGATIEKAVDKPASETSNSAAQGELGTSDTK